MPESWGLGNRDCGAAARERGISGAEYRFDVRLPKPAREDVEGYTKYLRTNQFFIPYVFSKSLTIQMLIVHVSHSILNNSRLNSRGTLSINLILHRSALVLTVSPNLR